MIAVTEEIKPRNGSGNALPQKPPYHPYVVLLVAILLPGFGHVLNGQARRGLTMQMFMIALAIITWQLAAPDRSLAGKLAGGLFIYALSIPDAYSVAKKRWVEYARNSRTPSP